MCLPPSRVARALINFINLGVFPRQIAGLSLLFNLVEIPAAAIAGASVYRERPAEAG